MNTLPGSALQIEHWPVERLRPYKSNARTHDDNQVEKIMASMQEYGFTNPVLVDGKDEIIAGHGRLMAAQRLGLETVPVVVLGYLTDAQKRAYVLADNRLALDAGWDEELLAQELARLDADGFDLALTGFDDDELADLLPDLDDEGPVTDPTASEDDVPDAAPVPTSRLGDLWRLGRHRLLCGDSTSGDDLARLLDGKLVDMLWTDPPYNVNYEGSAGKILNDNMSDDDFVQFLLAVFQNAIDHMHAGAPAYVAHADAGPMGVAFRVSFMQAGFKLASCLVWRKNTFVLGRADYHWKHEPILYGWKPGEAHRWYGERDKTTVVELDSPVITQVAEGEYHIDMGETGLVIRADNVTVQEVRGSVFHEEKPKRNSDHPTMKPVALIERMLENSSQHGDLVLDLFGGSGSTLIAAEKLKRDARLMELDPRFVDVIVRRWEEFTGRVARLDATGQSFDEVAALRDRPVIGGAGLMVAGRPFTEQPAANDNQAEKGKVA